MKKTITAFTFFIMLFAILLLSGCRAESTNTKEGSNSLKVERGRPDFGQPERKPDLTGIVRSITGNEVTIIKIERPERGLNGEQIEGEGSEEQRSVNPSRTFSGGGVHGGGFRGMGGSASDENRTAMLERIKEMSTGEETFIIPVGIRMLKPEFSGEERQPNMLEANLLDVKADKMINVWLDETIKNRKLASFVLIMR